MIRITVELLPNADEAKRREVATITVVNVSTHDRAEDRADEYEIKAIERAFRNEPEREFFAGFAHKPGDGALALLTTGLHAIGKRPNTAPPPPAQGSQPKESQS